MTVPCVQGRSVLLDYAEPTGHSRFFTQPVMLPSPLGPSAWLLDGGSQKRGQNGAELVPIPVLILSLLMGGFALERTGAVKAAVFATAHAVSKTGC